MTLADSFALGVLTAIVFGCAWLFVVIREQVRR